MFGIFVHYHESVQTGNFNELIYYLITAFVENIYYQDNLEQMHEYWISLYTDIESSVAE